MSHDSSLAPSAGHAAAVSINGLPSGANRQACLGWLSLPAGDVRALAAVSLAALLVTAAFWAWFEDERLIAGTDYAAFYEPVARNIVAGQGFVHGGEPAVRYPPGYPLLVAGVFLAAQVSGLSETVVFALVAHFATVLACIALFLAARSVWPSTSVLAPALWMTYPFALWLSLQRSTETVFTAILCIAIAIFWFALERARPHAASFALGGATVGFAMLVRPIAIGLWAIPLGLLWLLRRDLSRFQRLWLSGALVAGVFVVVAPWEIWVKQTTGRVVLLSDGGAPSIRDGLTFALNQKRFRVGVRVPDDVEALMWRIHERYDSLDTAGASAALVWEEFKDRPRTVLTLFAIKALRSWFGTDSHRREFLTAAVQLCYALPVLVGAWWSWRLGGKARRLLLLVSAVVLYFWLMTILVLSIARYMVPVMALLFLLVPAAADRIGLRWTRRLEAAA